MASSNGSCFGSDDDDDEAPDLVAVVLPADTNTDDAAAAAKESSSAAADSSEPLPPVPVTILTGFLGSGKTTLIRYILSSPDHGYRIAVIENEFGGGNDVQQGTAAAAAAASLAERTGLNVESIIARDGLTGSSLTDLIELPNGCVCCTVKDSLVETLENLLEKRHDIDYVVIEASGMANPGPIASVFWLDDALGCRLRLDGVVTCVDALNITMQLRETSSGGRSGSSWSRHDDGPDQHQDGGGDGGEEAAQQIAYADRIILNKIDLLSAVASNGNDDVATADATSANSGSGGRLNRSRHTGSSTTTLECVLDEIKAINPTAPVHSTTYSKVPDLGWILDAKCFDAERVKDVDATFARVSGNDEEDDEPGSCTNEDCNDDGHDHSHDHTHHHHHHRPSIGHHHHSHTSSVGTTALIQEGSVNLHRVHTWLASLLWPDQDEDDAVLTARLQQLMKEEEEAENGGGGDGSAQPSYDKSKQEVDSGKMRIFRIKGILSVRHDSSSLDDIDAPADAIDANGLDRRRHIVQGVNDLWEIHPGSDALRYEDGEERVCKLIFIGRCLDRESLLKGFDACFAS